MVLVDYLPAQLSDKKDWFVYFYAIDPDTNKLKRKRIKINKIKPVSLRRRMSKKIIHDLNLKLAAGWNPWVELEAPKSFVKLYEVIDTYMNEKKKETRPDTYRTYSSYTKIFKIWCDANSKSDLYVVNFKKQMALEVCKYLYMERDLGERTYNGYLAYFNSMFNWMVSNLYIRENPFATIKKKKTQAKKRILISDNDRENLKSWCLRENKQEFYCMILLAFHGLIRPLEITFLKPEYFDLVRGIILLPGKITKNGKSRISSLPDSVVDELYKLGINQMDETDYVFSKDFKPGKEKINPRVISKYWAVVVRRAINLEMEVQFYSLRDTGIVQMLKDGVSPNDVRIQADHSSLGITTEYLKHANPEGQSSIQHKSSSF